MHNDIFSEARLRGLTEKDWLYILSRAQAYSLETSHADSLAIQGREANQRIKLLEAQLAEARAERDAIIQQFAEPSSITRTDRDEATQTCPQSKETIEKVMQHLVTLKSVFNTLLTDTHILIPQTRRNTGAMAELGYRGREIFTKIEQVIKEMRAIDASASSSDENSQCSF